MLADRVRMGSIGSIELGHGSPKLISGTMEEGFFGEVPSSEFITGDALASECRISEGRSQHSTEPWLKFSYKGEILFVAKKTIRHSISWDAINTAKCVYGDSGDKRVVIDGKTYKVTLMRGTNPTNDPKAAASSDSGEINYHSEWNRLMCQIHEEAINGWRYSSNIESDIGILEHSLGSGSQGMYSDEDLIIAGSNNGRKSWCQEMARTSALRIRRGRYSVSHSDSIRSTTSNNRYGWRPVLRLV